MTAKGCQLQSFQFQPPFCEFRNSIPQFKKHLHQINDEGVYGVDK